jgi:hypothetical protein
MPRIYLSSSKMYRGIKCYVSIWTEEEGILERELIGPFEADGMKGEDDNIDGLLVAQNEIGRGHNFTIFEVEDGDIQWAIHEGPVPHEDCPGGIFKMGLRILVGDRSHFDRVPWAIRAVEKRLPQLRWK